MKRLFRLFLTLIVLSALVLPFAQVDTARASSTVRIYASMSSGMVFNVGTTGNYTAVQTATNGTVNVGSPTQYIGQDISGGNHSIHRTLFIFDTSEIPDTSVVASVSLNLYGAADISTTDFFIVVQTGNNTYPSNPILASDYDRTHYSDNFSSIHTASFSTTSYNVFNLNATGIASVNKTGETRFAIRSSRDINVTTPTTTERVFIYSNYWADSSVHPYLEVTYLVSSELVETNDASDILTTTATLQGELLSTGNATYVSVFFEYGTTVSYGSTTPIQNVITTGAFSQDISYLQYNQTYHFRAVAKFGSAYFYGQDLYFTTMPAVGSTTDLRIVSVAVFENYLENGDMLFCAEVINYYTGYYPNADPKKYFTIQLIDTNNTDILGATPLWNWGDRPVSIYVNAADATTFTAQSGYYIKMIGTLVTGSPSVSQQLTASDWYGYDFEGALDDWCKGVAINMELSDGRADYLTNITDQGLVITDAAGGYFTTGIPGITQERPNLFQTSRLTPDLDVGASSNVWDKADTDLVSGWRSYVGTHLSGDVDTMAAPFGVNGKDFAVGIIAFVMLGVMLMTVNATGGWGALGALLISVPILWLGVWFRIVPLAILVLIVLIFAAFYIRQFFVKTL